MRYRSLAVVVVALLSLCGSGAVSAAPAGAGVQEASAPTGCHYGQCNAIAKSTGLQCKHCVSNPGDLYCWQHR